MKHPPVLPCASALLLAAATASGQSYIEVPGSQGVYDVTPDGEIVCGVGSGGGFYWRWRTEPAPTFIGGNDAVAISDDGSVIVGCIGPGLGEEAAMWTQATGWVSLGALPNALNCPSRSNAYDVSGDGKTVIGLSWDGCSGRGFIWTQATGMLELQNLVNGQNRASAIAADGSRIGGFAQSFNRTPALWLPNLAGQVYNANDFGEVYGFSDDGGIVVGTYNGEGFYDDGQGPVLIGSLNGGNWIGNAVDVTEDGGRIVGFDNAGLSRQATIWSPGNGWELLEDRLAAYHVATPSLHVCLAQTPDGGVIVGHNTFQGWIATLPHETGKYCTAKTNSCGSQPSIASIGAPSATAGSGFTVSAVNTRALRAGLLIYTDSGRANVPFLGGTLCINTSPLRRTVAVIDTAGTPGQCDGVLSLDMNCFAAGACGGNPLSSLTVPGTRINCQYWGRDTIANGALLSDALEYFVGS